jgi:hypothetical protein
MISVSLVLIGEQQHPSPGCTIRERDPQSQKRSNQPPGSRSAIAPPSLPAPRVSPEQY